MIGVRTSRMACLGVLALVGITAASIRPTEAQGTRTDAAPHDMTGTECARLHGQLVAPERRVAVYAPSGDFSFVLPGIGWCEAYFREALFPTYLHVDGAAPAQATSIIVKVTPLSWPADKPFPTAGAMRDALLDHRKTGRIRPGFEDLIALAPPAAGGVAADMGITDAPLSCFWIRRNDAQGVGGNRRSNMETRFCFGPAEARTGVVLVVIGSYPAAMRRQLEDVRARAEAIVASLAFDAPSARPEAPCLALAQQFGALLPRCAARLGVRAEPGKPGAVEVATGCLLSLFEGSPLDATGQQRCYSEVLRNAGFRDALPMQAAQRGLRTRQ